ncbi:hypothetical protein [Massilia frigida]|nr:hypothetical protein [Massilia frigida]
MMNFTVTIRTIFAVTQCVALSMTSFAAYLDAADTQGDVPYSITVVPKAA